MGVMKFRLPSNEPALQVADFRKAYVTGLDRTPSRIGVELRNGLMTCARDTMESGRLFVPWPVPGYGMPIIGTATLAERPVPYVLAVELARGKLNDVRNQLADWTLMGLRPTVELDQALGDAQHAFIRAATSTDRPDVSLAAAQASLQAATRAGDLLMDAYTSQILQSRLLASSRLPTRLGCMLDVPPQKLPSSVDWPTTFNTCHIGVTWKQIAPTEGRYSWEVFDALLAWGKGLGMAIEAGPIVDFRQGALPDWIWLWQGDGETISGLVAEFVRQAVARYKGKIPLWHLVHRMASGEILGLSEEDQIRIAVCHPGGATDRPRGSVDNRRRSPLGRVDGVEPLPARAAPSLRLLAAGRHRALGRRYRNRAGLLAAGQSSSRPLRILQTSRPLFAVECATAHLDGPSLGPGARPQCRSADSGAAGAVGCATRRQSSI